MILIACMRTAMARARLRIRAIQPVPLLFALMLYWTRWRFRTRIRHITPLDGYAKLLNKYFTSISTVNDENATLPAFEYKCQNRISSITCTSDEVASLIELLNPNKATGPDGISNKMLKAVSKEIAVPLSILFNRSFREGKFGEIYKYSNVIPYPKREITLILQHFDQFHS